jgi:hypothetical protein
MVVDGGKAGEDAADFRGGEGQEIGIEVGFRLSLRQLSLV